MNIMDQNQTEKKNKFNYRYARLYPKMFALNPNLFCKYSAFPTFSGPLSGTNDQADFDEKTHVLKIKLYHEDNPFGLHIDGVIGLVSSWMMQRCSDQKDTNDKVITKADPACQQALICLQMTNRIMDKRAMEKHGYQQAPHEQMVVVPPMPCTREEWMGIYDTMKLFT